MSESRVKQIQQFGQSIWLDNIGRGFIASGGLQKLVDEDGLRGVTSNPAIFEKAIDGSSDYDEEISRLIGQNRSLVEIYESLAIDDIRAAATVLRPVFDANGGKDGFVSLEVPADIANDTQTTIREARRLHETLNLPNLMVKIPATKEGVPAIRQMIAEGRNINVTLIFSRDRYREVMEAYISGLEDRDKKGLPVAGINSVASFFVSRIDSAADKQIDQKLTGASPEQQKTLESLKGQVAIANAKLAYQDFKATFSTDRFQKLAAKGAAVQRPLWASTSTKNPQYRDVVYIEELIGPDTVDTAPPATIDAFRDHGEAAARLETGVDHARRVLQDLERVGIDLAAITHELEIDGVKLFTDAMTKLMDSLQSKHDQLLKAA